MFLIHADDADVRPEDAQYTIDILTKCRANKDYSRGKIVQTVPLTEPGEPLVVAVPLSQVITLSKLYNCMPLFTIPRKMYKLVAC